VAAAVLAVGVAAGLDCRGPVAQRPSTKAAVWLLHRYRATLSPVLDSVGVRCRMEPTCSRYAEACVSRHGVVRGGLMAAWRVARCGPWTPRGTSDPPPPAADVPLR
jgi:putative membrane protein insertion efficiency factor